MTHIETAQGRDAAAVSVHSDDIRDFIEWNPVALLEKYDQEMTEWVASESRILRPQGSDFEALNVKPYETLESVGNLLTTAGLTRITSLITAGGGTALTATTGRIGVGNSSTAEAVGQTDLQAAAGAANRQFYVLDNATPTTAAGVITCRASFATADANFAWNEWGIDIGAATVANGTTVNATLLNRKVQSLGTKVSGTWVLTVSLTLS